MRRPTTWFCEYAKSLRQGIRSGKTLGYMDSGSASVCTLVSSAFDTARVYEELLAYIAGETTPAVWHAVVNVVVALRRASETAVEAARRWPQRWPTAEEW